MMRNKDEMLILGLTGGIGCGKTAVLTILKEEYDANNRSRPSGT